MGIFPQLILFAPPTASTSRYFNSFFLILNTGISYKVLKNVCFFVR